MIYKTLVLTGLRKGELASITVGQCVLDSDPPCLILSAADAKNREGSTIPLRADLADDLRQWLDDKATAVLDAAREAPAVQFDSKHQKHGKRNASDSTGREGQNCLPLTRLPFGLPADTRLFNLPRIWLGCWNKTFCAGSTSGRTRPGGLTHALRSSFLEPP